MSGSIEYDAVGIGPTSDTVYLTGLEPNFESDGTVLLGLASYNQELFEVSSPGPITFEERIDGKVVGTAVFDNKGHAFAYYDADTQQYVLGDVGTFGTITGEFDAYPCFASGTRLAAPAGAIAVEDLRQGDVVTTTDGPLAVRWIGHRRARDGHVVRIRTGVLGATADLVVSEDHALHVDGALVPAGLLVDGDGIVRERRAEVTFWHVELERHAILIADGVQAESYLDTGNRRQFGNCPLGYDASRPGGEPCAPLVVAGARLARIRAGLSVPA